MLGLSLILVASTSISALATIVLLRHRVSRVLLKSLQLALIFGVALYVVAFLVFYRPEIWPAVAFDLAASLARVDLEALAVLGGSVSGTLLVQLASRQVKS